MKKKLLAVLLTISMVVSGNAAVMAEPAQDVKTVSSQEVNAGEQSVPAAGEETNENAGVQTSSNVVKTPEAETPSAETPEVQTPETQEPTVSQESAPEPETVSEDVPAPCGETEQEEAVSGDTVVSENAPGAQSEDEELARALEDVPLMISSLNAEENAVYKRFADLKPEEADINWDADEAFFEADSEEEAKRVAKSYGAELVCFQYGIATIRFNLENRDLSNVLLRNMYTANYKGNTDAILEADLWPNYLDHIYEEPESAVCTADPDYKLQWYHEVISDNAAWAASNKGDGAVVCVIDTGVDTDHPDLKGNLKGAYESCADGDSVEDEHSHGTHCLGIVGALENDIGGVGVAPKASLISIRAANSGGGFATADVIAAIKMATAEGVNVISMSFGGNRPEVPAEKKALEEAYSKGIMLVAAAGNDGNNVYSLPAAYDCVLAVASYDEGDTLSSFSTYGDWVEIAAPGGDIYSTVLNGKFNYKSGTSMACPCVAGVAALTYASSKELLEGTTAETSAKVRQILIESRNDKEYFYTPKGGTPHSVKGGVNPLGAVTYLKNEEADEAVTVEVPSKPDIQVETDAKTGAATVKITGEATEIHYTTDGSEPDLTDKIYKTPFILSEEGKYVVKAVAVNRASKKSKGYKTVASEVVQKNITVRVPTRATYDDNEIFVIPDFEGPLSLVPGKSIKLTGTVSPNNSVKKTLVFEKTGGSDSISVTPAGQVKASNSAGSGDSATIKMGVKDCPGAKAATVTINISSKSAVDSVTSGYGNTVQELWTVGVDGTVSDNSVSNNSNSKMKNTLDATKGLTPKFGGDVAYSFKSSNVKTAVVDSKGIVRALGNGNVIITVTAMDGSNKSAKIKVKCMTPVTDMYIISNAGQADSSKIGVGSSIQLKPVLSGKGSLEPSNKKVTWKLKSGSNSYFTVSKSGRVTCNKNAKEGSTAIVSCTADDGSKTAAEYELVVRKKIKYMGIIKKTVAVIKTVRRTKYIVGFRNNFASSAVSSKSVKCGEELDIRVADDFIDGKNGPVCADKNTYNTQIYSQGRYVYIDDVTEVMDPDDYIVSVGRSKNLLILDKDERGSVNSISVSKPGTYTVTYKAVDGSNKKFTLRIKVKK